MKGQVTRGPSAMELADLPVPEGTVLGHEVSGTVVEVGGRVRDAKPGDRVALEPAIPCRRCWFCQRGQYHMCPQTVHLGNSVPGGFAEYLTIHEMNAHIIPATLPLREAALLEPLRICLAGLRRARLQMARRSPCLAMERSASSLPV